MEQAGGYTNKNYSNPPSPYGQPGWVLFGVLVVWTTLVPKPAPTALGLGKVSLTRQGFVKGFDDHCLRCYFFLTAFALQEPERTIGII